MKDGGLTDDAPEGEGPGLRGRGQRIHIFGPSGAGVSTLGRALAGKLGSQHFDTDDFYWRPTDPPFREKRPVEERRALMQALFLPRSDWVLSGAMESWAGGIARRFSTAIFLDLDQAERRARLLARERRRHGTDAEPGGVAHDEVRAFLNWADGYEHGRRPGRSRARHEAWIETLACPVIRLEATDPPDHLATRVIEELERQGTPN